ncbi:hypothetical protein PTSG_11463, partial [Salpingoeca rosetta]
MSPPPSAHEHAHSDTEAATPTPPAPPVPPASSLSSALTPSPSSPDPSRTTHGKRRDVRGTIGRYIEEPKTTHHSGDRTHDDPFQQVVVQEYADTTKEGISKQARDIQLRAIAIRSKNAKRETVFQSLASKAAKTDDYEEDLMARVRAENDARIADAALHSNSNDDHLAGVVEGDTSQFRALLEELGPAAKHSKNSSFGFGDEALLSESTTEDNSAALRQHGTQDQHAASTYNYNGSVGADDSTYKRGYGGDNGDNDDNNNDNDDDDDEGDDDEDYDEGLASSSSHASYDVSASTLHGRFALRDPIPGLSSSDTDISRLDKPGRSSIKPPSSPVPAKAKRVRWARAVTVVDTAGRLSPVVRSPRNPPVQHRNNPYCGSPLPQRAGSGRSFSTITPVVVSPTHDKVPGNTSGNSGGDGGDGGERHHHDSQQQRHEGRGLRRDQRHRTSTPPPPRSFSPTVDVVAREAEDAYITIVANNSMSSSTNTTTTATTMTIGRSTTRETRARASITRGDSTDEYRGFADIHDDGDDGGDDGDSDDGGDHLRAGRSNADNTHTSPTPDTSTGHASQRSLYANVPGVIKGAVLQRSWLENDVSYQPADYTATAVLSAGDADPQDPSSIRFNASGIAAEDGVDRRSVAGTYVVFNNRPLNPCGRTGIAGRGVLKRWGPNPTFHCFVTRYARDASGKLLMTKGAQSLEVLLLQFPGGDFDAPQVKSNTADAFLSMLLDKGRHDLRTLSSQSARVSALRIDTAELSRQLESTLGAKQPLRSCYK